MQNLNPQIEVYVNLKNEELNTAIQQMLSSLAPEQVIKRTLQEGGVTLPVSLTLVITDDEEIQLLNKQYRQQDKPTDVLSFPLLDKPLVKAPADQLWMAQEAVGGEASREERTPAFVTPAELATNLGDIVISWPTVLRQATEAGHDAAYELRYLLSHGLLHLIGYDDQTEAGYQAMVKLQEAVMKAIERKAYLE